MSRKVEAIRSYLMSIGEIYIENTLRLDSGDTQSQLRALVEKVDQIPMDDLEDMLSIQEISSFLVTLKHIVPALLGNPLPTDHTLLVLLAPFGSEASAVCDAMQDAVEKTTAKRRQTSSTNELSFANVLQNLYVDSQMYKDTNLQFPEFKNALIRLYIEMQRISSQSSKDLNQDMCQLALEKMGTELGKACELPTHFRCFVLISLLVGGAIKSISAADQARVKFIFATNCGRDVAELMYTLIKRINALIDFCLDTTPAPMVTSFENTQQVGAASAGTEQATQDDLAEKFAGAALR